MQLSPYFTRKPVICVSLFSLRQRKPGPAIVSLYSGVVRTDAEGTEPYLLHYLHNNCLYCSCFKEGESACQRVCFCLRLYRLSSSRKEFHSTMYQKLLVSSCKTHWKWEVPTQLKIRGFENHSPTVKPIVLPLKRKLIVLKILGLLVKRRMGFKPIVLKMKPILLQTQTPSRLKDVANVTYKTIFHIKNCLRTWFQANTHFAPNFDNKH